MSGISGNTMFSLPLKDWAKVFREVALGLCAVFGFIGSALIMLGIIEVPGQTTIQQVDTVNIESKLDNKYATKEKVADTAIQMQLQLDAYNKRLEKMEEANNKRLERIEQGQDSMAGDIKKILERLPPK